MKRVSILFLLLMIIVMPTVVCASSFTLSCNKTDVDVGDTINCSVVVTPDEGVTEISGSISSSGSLESSSSTIDGLNTQVTISAVSAGSGTVTANVTAGDDVLASQSIQITVKEGALIPSPDDTDLSLSSLSIDGNSISVSKDKTEYTYTTDKNSVNISATGIEGATISGTGKKTLNDGSNTFQVIVSKNGNSKTYNVIITKNKTEIINSDSPKLKSIKLSSGTVNFNPDTLEYNVSVESNVNQVTLTATADTGAQIKYSPSSSVSLKYGEIKTVSIIVIKDGVSTTYKVNIIRQDQNGDITGSSNIAVGNAKLKSLTIDEIPFTFDPNTLEYNLNVENNIDEITLKYEVSDPSLSAKVVGNTQLKEGKNKIKIVVSTESGKSNTYILNITRNKTRTVVENKEESIIEKLNDESDLNDIYVSVDNEDEKIITSSILKSLKDSKKKLTYEIIKNSGILYSIEFDGTKINNTDDFNYQITLISEDEEDIYNLIKTSKYLSLKFKDKGNIPGEAKLNIYVGDTRIKDLKKVNLYKYKNNELILVKKDIKIDDGYIELTLDSNSEYVIGKYSKIKSVDYSKNQIIVAAIIILLSFVVSFILIKIKKNKKNNNY